MDNLRPHYNYVEDPPPSNLQCNICHDVFLTHRSCSTCNTSFCKECVERWFKTQKRQAQACTCPCCRRPVKVSTLGHNATLQEQADSLLVYCPHADAGCSSVPSRKDLADHVRNECAYQEIPCELCDDLVLRSKMATHLSQSCMYRQIPCPYVNEGCACCTTEMNLEEHVKKYCPKAELTCCHCKFSVKREACLHHMLFVCPILADCPYRMYGCSVHGTRIDVSQHLASCPYSIRKERFSRFIADEDSLDPCLSLATSRPACDIDSTREQDDPEFMRFLQPSYAVEDSASAQEMTYTDAQMSTEESPEGEKAGISGPSAGVSSADQPQLLSVPDTAQLLYLQLISAFYKDIRVVNDKKKNNTGDDDVRNSILNVFKVQDSPLDVPPEMDRIMHRGYWGYWGYGLLTLAEKLAPGVRLSWQALSVLNDILTTLGKRVMAVVVDMDMNPMDIDSPDAHTPMPARPVRLAVSMVLPRCVVEEAVNFAGPFDAKFEDLACGDMVYETWESVSTKLGLSLELGKVTLLMAQFVPMMEWPDEEEDDDDDDDDDDGDDGDEEDANGNQRPGVIRVVEGAPEVMAQGTGGEEGAGPARVAPADGDAVMDDQASESGGSEEWESASADEIVAMAGSEYVPRRIAFGPVVPRVTYRRVGDSGTESEGDDDDNDDDDDDSGVIDGEDLPNIIFLTAVLEWFATRIINASVRHILPSDFTHDPKCDAVTEEASTSSQDDGIISQILKLVPGLSQLPSSSRATEALQESASTSASSRILPLTGLAGAELKDGTLVVLPDESAIISGPILQAHHIHQALHEDPALSTFLLDAMGHGIAHAHIRHPRPEMAAMMEGNSQRSIKGDLEPWFAALAVASEVGTPALHPADLHVYCGGAGCSFDSSNQCQRCSALSGQPPFSPSTLFALHSRIFSLPSCDFHNLRKDLDLFNEVPLLAEVRKLVPTAKTHNNRPIKVSQELDLLIGIIDGIVLHNLAREWWWSEAAICVLDETDKQWLAHVQAARLPLLDMQVSRDVKREAQSCIGAGRNGLLANLSLGSDALMDLIEEVMADVTAQPSSLDRIVSSRPTALLPTRSPQERPQLTDEAIAALASGAEQMLTSLLQKGAAFSTFAERREVRPSDWKMAEMISGSQDISADGRGARGANALYPRMW